ncbi:MAG TPA: ATP-grasp domain-containing protein [Patescibacteria group bacterium]|nr:ATP-grasp domain-containing protein [Patescibacteria group bacterium]
MDLKVLWTISGSMGTMADIDMLKKAKSFDIEVVTTDVEDKDTAGFIVTGKKYVVPKVKDSTYIDALLKICQSEKITTIIPQYTDELILMSESNDLFKRFGIKVLVTEDIEKLKVANSKDALYKFFKQKTFVPKYTLASTIDSIKAAVLALGYPGVPVCIKPVKGEGGKGFRIITEEKVDIFNEPIGSAKINLEAYINQLKALPEIPELLVSEYLPGKEYSVDCVCKDGITFFCIPRQRIETSMGVSSVSLIEKNEELIAYSKEIISALKLSYNINIQFKYSNEERPMLIEINPRVSGSLVANYGAGINMLEEALRLAYGMPVTNIDIKWGTKMLRHWSQIFIQV